MSTYTYGQPVLFIPPGCAAVKTVIVEVRSGIFAAEVYPGTIADYEALIAQGTWDESQGGTSLAYAHELAPLEES